MLRAKKKGKARLRLRCFHGCAAMQASYYWPYLCPEDFYDYSCQYDYYNAYSFFYPTENHTIFNNDMQKRDLKRDVKRERLSSSGSSIGDTSEDEGTSECLLYTRDVNDPRLLKAASTAVQEKNVLPLIKEELRSTILFRRSQQGLGDIKFEEKKPLPKKVC